MRVLGNSISPYMAFPSTAERRNPRPMPVRPPRPLRMAASTRNCVTISRRGAPMDFLMPISRVRSVTVTSMIFMIPMPPTSSAMPAMPPRTTLMEVISSLEAVMAALPSVRV